MQVCGLDGGRDRCSRPRHSLSVSVFHPGYGRFGGPKTDPVQLKAIFKAMEDNGLMRPVRVLTGARWTDWTLHRALLTEIRATGFIPGSEALKVVAELVKQLKTTRPSLPYILDRAFWFPSKRIYI